MSDNRVTNVLLDETPEGQTTLAQKGLGSSALPRRQAPILETRPMGVKSRISKSGSIVKYKKKIRRVTLQRLLCSRFAFSLEKVRQEELLVLYDNLLHCQDLAEKDPDFNKKFGKSLEDLTKILKSQNLLREIPVISKSLAKSFRANLQSFLIPERNLAQVEHHMKDAYRIAPTSLPGTLRRYLPPKTFIGVGYKDKGSRRNLAKDGTPHWTEVAMATGVLEKENN